MNLIATQTTGVRVSQQPSYGVLSWLFFALCALVSVAFLSVHGVIQGVRFDVLTIRQLEALFFPGVYWTLAASCISLLALSALLIGLTSAMALVRTYLHVAPCRLYWWALVLQTLPWLYFLGSTS